MNNKILWWPLTASLVLAGCSTNHPANRDPIIINRALGYYTVTITAKAEDNLPVQAFSAHIATNAGDTGWRNATNGTVVIGLNAIDSYADIVAAKTNDPMFYVETNFPGIHQNIELNLTLKQHPADSQTK